MKVRCRACAATLEVELADTRVPDAALGILVDMVEGHAIQQCVFFFAVTDSVTASSNLQSCLLACPALMITSHVLAVRLSPDHATGLLAAAVSA